MSLYKEIKKYSIRGKNYIAKKSKELYSSLVFRIVLCAAASCLAGLMAASVFSGFFSYYGAPAEFFVWAVVTVFIFIKLTRHTMKYVKDIAKAVEQISEGDYTVRIPEKYTDEMGGLATRINQMAADLSKSREWENLQEERKNEFITSMAHDLRTPLTSIIGYLGLISEQDEEQEVERETLVKYADIAYRKSKRMEQLIAALFDFARYNFDEIRPAKDQIDLAELIEQMDQEFYPQYADCKLESRVIISGRPVLVPGDGSMLARVFDNILNNAIRYGESGKYIDIELHNRGREAMVRITNYGSSIDEKDLERIFDKFYRTDASRSSKTGGTGLGMAIAKNIVEAHGGSIQAKSGDGKVTFRVILPTILSKAAEIEPKFIQPSVPAAEYSQAAPIGEPIKQPIREPVRQPLNNLQNPVPAGTGNPAWRQTPAQLPAGGGPPCRMQKNFAGGNTDTQAVAVTQNPQNQAEPPQKKEAGDIQFFSEDANASEPMEESCPDKLPPGEAENIVAANAVASEDPAENIITAQSIEPAEEGIKKAVPYTPGL